MFYHLFVYIMYFFMPLNLNLFTNYFINFYHFTLTKLIIMNFYLILFYF